MATEADLAPVLRHRISCTLLYQFVSAFTWNNAGAPNNGDVISMLTESFCYSSWMKSSNLYVSAVNGSLDESTFPNLDQNEVKQFM